MKRSLSKQPLLISGDRKLIEVRRGLLINLDHVVSVRVLPVPQGVRFAMLQLSNGENHYITQGEFAAIAGEVPRLNVI